METHLAEPDLTTPCKDAAELQAWIAHHCKLRVPAKPVCPHHQAPMDYLATAYFEPSRDQVVWAPRGGGKTSLAAVATLLDLLHKPGVSIRILGGSLTQSLRMWEYLIPYFQQSEKLMKMLEKPNALARRIQLDNGSSAAVLTQSQRCVRGLRVQKLRCDEVDLFDESVWSAAQLTTRSEDCDGNAVSGTIEALSTLHNPGGLMQKIVDHAPGKRAKLVRWCLLDVLERCPPERSCDACPLWDECRGIAKTHCEGYFRIEDAIVMKSRVSLEVWKSEIMCERPSRSDSVFPMMEESLHVRSETPFTIDKDCDWWLGVDFGYNAPLVCLWIITKGTQVYVIDEHVERKKTLGEHVEAWHAKPWPRVPRIACDPAGNAKNEQTSQSNVDYLRDRGYRVKSRPSRIIEGVEAVRAALRSATGHTRLFIHPRCTNLLSALRNYRYSNETTELPHKDGINDHAVDALRYFFINQHWSRTTSRAY